MTIVEKARIRELRDKLKETDHYILKIQECIVLNEEVPQKYKDVINDRRAWRLELNELEAIHNGQ